LIVCDVLTLPSGAGFSPREALRLFHNIIISLDSGEKAFQSRDIADNRLFSSQMPLPTFRLAHHIIPLNVTIQVPHTRLRSARGTEESGEVPEEVPLEFTKHDGANVQVSWQKRIGFWVIYQVSMGETGW
jgi:hypothetical protein